MSSEGVSISDVTSTPRWSTASELLLKASVIVTLNIRDTKKTPLKRVRKILLWLLLKTDGAS